MHATLLALMTLAGADSIDSLLESAWAERGLQPAPQCSDEQFLRRVTLDLAGRIPTVGEQRAFREAPDRSAAIDRLLASEDFPRFWSEVWTANLIGHTQAFNTDRVVFQKWLEASIRQDVPYDRLVTELIAARGSSALDGPVNFLIRYPDEPVVKVSRLFLGVRLDCARCHDHPFDRWTAEDFELMSRFFDPLQRREISQGNIRLSDGRPQADDAERPRFLTGARPRTSQWRGELALFITNSKPFARAYANRLWYHFLGRGLVDPVDDFHRENPPSVPELMRFLTQQMRSHRFALRPMIRLICNSRAYQLASTDDNRTPEREALFAFRKLKPLTPEQTYDSALLALGVKGQPNQRRQFIQRSVGRSLDEDFSHTWEYRETVQDLLVRLNRDIPAPTSSITSLYRRILSRDPSSRELALCKDQSPRDIVFALVNSNEFFFNH